MWVASIVVTVLCLLMPLMAIAEDSEKEQERVKASGEALDALLNGPNGIPINLLNKAECVIILPSVKKAGFIVAGSYGRGVMTCRSEETFTGRWSAPI